SRLLRSRRKRRSDCRATKQRNELTPPHVFPSGQEFHPTTLPARLCITANSGGSCPLWVKSRHSGASASCPLCPQKRTWVELVVMSALCQKRTHAPQQSASYSITPSAATNILCGNVMPSAFAV